MSHEYGDKPGVSTDEHDIGHAALFGVDYAGVHDEERNKEMSMPVQVVERMEYGTGAIDGAECSREQFEAALTFLANEGLTSIGTINAERKKLGKEPIYSIFDIPGNCMDGRGNRLTLAGEKVEIARPKVVGGPTLYLTNILSIVDVLDGQMIDRFGRVAEMFPRAAAMHEACGMAAKGSEPVLVAYHDRFDEIDASVADLTHGHLRATPTQKEAILRGIRTTIERVQKEQDSYNESAMIGRVRQINGDQAVLRYVVDENEPNHSHKEVGIVNLFSSDDLIMVKDAVAQNSGIPDLFYHNAGYGKKLVKMSIGVANKDTLALGQLAGMHLPLAANATLGKNQWLGSVGNYEEMSKHFYAA